MPTRAFAPSLVKRITVGVATVLAVLFLENAATSLFFPRLERVETDFSPAYLQREIAVLRGEPPQTIFLGDSVLWGFRLRADQTAVSLLRRRGCACVNLAFKAGSPPNAYAIAKLLLADDVRPRSVVIEINQKVLNAADASYSSLHPAVAALASPLLSPSERSQLVSDPKTSDIERRVDGLFSKLWLPYAMRSDIRELVADAPDPVPSHPLSADDFEGTYDLQPLTMANVGVRYLDRTVVLLRRAGIPVFAFTTPTNHALLHDYIDGPEYRRNQSFLMSLLRRDGARVVDLDERFPAREFFDEDHLTADGNMRLAAVLGPLIRSQGTTSIAHSLEPRLASTRTPWRT